MTSCGFTQAGFAHSLSLTQRGVEGDECEEGFAEGSLCVSVTQEGQTHQDLFYLMFRVYDELLTSFLF